MRLHWDNDYKFEAIKSFKIKILINVLENMKEIHLNFLKRHLGPSNTDIDLMLKSMSINTIDELIKKVIPSNILSKIDEDLIDINLSEDEVLFKLKGYANKNTLYSLSLEWLLWTIVPNVIKRNIFENPGWYTQYTPYQAEISQGRLEALLNFQTLISSSTDLPIANASLLDEGTAALKR